MSELDALILTDQYDSKELLRSSITNCLDAGLKVKTVTPQGLEQFFKEKEQSLTEPILFFSDSSVRHQNFLEILRFHRLKPDFSYFFSLNGWEVISLNPKKIKVNQGKILLKDSNSNPFLANHSTSKLIPQVSPVSIFVRAHNRPDYLQLTLNGLVSSLGENIKTLPIILVLSCPSSGVMKTAQQFLSKYSLAQAIAIQPNSYLGTGKYGMLWAKRHGYLNKSAILFEDDFILPGTVKDLYSNWPWWFSHRLQFFDIVCWSPALENLPLSFHQTVLLENNIVATMNLNVDRKYFPGSKWIDTSDNSNIFTCGTAIGFEIEYYEQCSRNRNLGYAIDLDLNALKRGATTPIIHGYHIGWNQEQDGYISLLKPRWGNVPEKATVENLRTGEKEEFVLKDPLV